jgi:hypothetical protein
MMRLCVLALCGLSVPLAGCGGSASGGRYPVSGKVTLQNEPLKTGTIEFDSPESRSGASIVDGSYTIPAPQGLLPGKYTVRISSVSAASSTPAMPGDSSAIEKTNKELIPAEFNTKSTLTYEVGPGKATNFDVNIP